jgi:hypothetical protein
MLTYRERADICRQVERERIEQGFGGCPDFWHEGDAAVFHRLLELSRELWDGYWHPEAAFHVLEAAAKLPAKASVALDGIEPLVRERLQVAEAEYAAGGAPAFENVCDERCDRDGYRLLVGKLWGLKFTADDVMRFSPVRVQWNRYEWHEGPPTDAQRAAAQQKMAAFEAKERTPAADGGIS